MNFKGTKEFCTNILLTVVSFGRLIKYSKIAHRFPLKIRVSRSLCIIGNGPSLKESLNESCFAEFIEDKDVFCVNTFVLSEQFIELKPQYYLFLDPEFWESTATDESQKLSQDILNRLQQVTTWKMKIFLPINAKKSLFAQKLTLINNITLSYFNNCPFNGFKWLRFFMYSKGASMPLGQNVLIGALFLGINMGYRKIYVIGADMSLHQNVVLRQDNIICGHVQRFYEDTLTTVTEVVPFLNQGATPYWRMAELFQAFADTFKAFEDIAEYAHYVDVKVYNVSKVTFIDVFERCGIRDCLD